MTSAERAGRGSAPARAALAGNPSDGYGGAVLAIAVDELRATVRATPAGELDVEPDSALVSAAVARVVRELIPGADRCALQWGTSIPRGVGLGGSSAIVIATIRALCQLHGASIEPDSLAALALAVEAEDLGIAAGPQDRVAEAYGGLTFMDFAAAGRDRYERLDPGLLRPLLVCWRHETSADSGPLHSDLRERFDRGNRDVRDAIEAATRAGHEARAALLRGDHPEFCRAVDATFDARRRMMKLDPRHVEMIELARAAGAAANYTGSGGAIVAVCSAAPHREALATEMRGAGCEVVMV